MKSEKGRGNFGKRSFDFLIASLALTFLAPLLAAIAAAIWFDDRHFPFSFGLRVGCGGDDFRSVKFRTMIPGARITRLGTSLRRTRLDELPLLWNVFTGDMSLVGPQGQVRADASLYTIEEARLLDTRPGMTDLASVVFADEGEILSGSSDPGLVYNQIVRPWKSRLALLYLDHRSFSRDLQILWITALALFSRARALRAVAMLLDAMGASEKLKTMAARRVPLEAFPPPGAQIIVTRHRAAAG
jgi:lipopolysaccharide/colanic/teichoic acid biosynthesis glycosyltransferase